MVRPMFVVSGEERPFPNGLSVMAAKKNERLMRPLKSQITVLSPQSLKHIHYPWLLFSAFYLHSSYTTLQETVALL